MEYFSATHTLSPRTFYELRVYHSASEIDSAEVPGVSTDIEKDTDGWFNLPRQVKWYNLESRHRYGVKLDLSSQRTKGHFLKTGLDLMAQRVWTVEVAEPTSAERRISFIGNGTWQEPYTPITLSLYVQDKMEFEGLIINAGLRYDRFWIREKVPMWKQYGAAPMYFTFLHSRDIPRESMPAVQTLAPRIGISHPITDRSAVHIAYGRYYQIPTIWSFLGQEWGTNSGDEDRNRNDQIDAGERYNTYGSVRGAATVAGARLRHGNTRQLPEQTTSFEVGVDWNFALDYIFGLTTFYRSVKNKTYGGSWNFTDPSGISLIQPTETYEAGNYEDVRGFELGFRKPFSHAFSFRVAYNVQWASRGQTSYRASDPMPDSNFVANGHYWNTWTTDAGGNDVPESLRDKAAREGKGDLDFYIKEYGSKANQSIENYESGRRDDGRTVEIDPDRSDQENGLWIYKPDRGHYETNSQLGRDRRYYGSVAFLFSSPHEFGPGFRGWWLLGDLRANLVYKIQTGTPYRYTPPDGPQEWRYRPMSTVTDLSMEKSFPGLKPVQPTFFLEIDNVFNQKDNSSVGPNNQEYIQWGLNIPKPDDPDYVQWGDPDDMDRYVGRPREIRLGVRLFF